MRITFITGDHVYRALSISEILRDREGLGASDDYQFVIEDFILPGKSSFQALLYIFRKSGYRYFFYKIIESFSCTLAIIVNRTLGRSEKIPTISSLIAGSGAQSFHTKDVNTRQTLDHIRAFSPDVIISMGMQRIQHPMIGIPELGVVNIHLGLLPDYRGLGCYIYPLLDGVKETGATVHYILDEEFDEGDILGKGFYTISPKDSINTLHLKNARLGGEVAAKTLRDLEKGTLESSPQKGGRYFSFPNARQISDLAALGRVLIHFRDVLRLILKGPPEGSGEVIELVGVATPAKSSQETPRSEK